MDAANRAAFNLVLSQEGAIIMEQALKEGVTPVGVVYSLSYLALRPALDVTITAHMEQVFTHLSAGLEGQYMFFKAGIEAAMEWLQAKGAIDIVVQQLHRRGRREGAGEVGAPALHRPPARRLVHAHARPRAAARPADADARLR